MISLQFETERKQFVHTVYCTVTTESDKNIILYSVTIFDYWLFLNVFTFLNFEIKFL